MTKLGNFYLKNKKPPKELIKVLQTNCAYIVLKGHNYNNLESIFQKYYKLSQGDIIKMGRIYIKVLEINLENESEEHFNKFGTEINNVNDSKCSIFRHSSFRSAKVNEQEILCGKGKMHGLKDLKTMKVINSIKQNNNDKNIFVNKHRANFITNNNSLNFNNNIKVLARNNSANEDILIFSQNKKRKNNNDKVGQKKIINSLLADKNSNFEEVKNKKKKKIKKPRICRICYGKDITFDNPLICPCICKGSMKYIHYKCLKNWLTSKIEIDQSINPEIEEEVGLTYCAKDLSCELCKTKFPDYINHNGKIYNLAFYKPKFKQYIILESIRADKFKTKFIHILSFDHGKNQIALGRSNDCELSIPELSISRFHCFIHKVKNNILIQDNNSKFGTCILIQNPNILITDNSPLRILKEKTYIKIKLLMPSVFFSCCNANTFDSKFYTYEAQNHKYCDVASSFVIKIDNLDDDSDYDEDRASQNEIGNIILKKSNKDLLGESKNSITTKKTKNIRKIVIKEQRKIPKKLINLSNQGNDNKINISQMLLNGFETAKNINLINLNINKDNDKSRNSYDECIEKKSGLFSSSMKNDKDNVDKKNELIESYKSSKIINIEEKKSSNNSRNESKKD